MRTITTLVATGTVTAAVAAVTLGVAVDHPGLAAQTTHAAPTASIPYALSPGVPASPDNAAGPAPQIRSLAEALRTDLGLTPEQFLAQAGAGDRLGRFAQDAAARFAAVFGGAWLTPAGVPTVGVAPGTQAAGLTAAATKAGFQVHDVALTSTQLAGRQKQVTDAVNALPADVRALVVGLSVDETRNAVVVTTKGGTPDQLGRLRAALAGLAVVEPAYEPTAAGSNPVAAAGQSIVQALNNSGYFPDGVGATIVNLLLGLRTATGSVLEGAQQTAPDPRPTSPTVPAAPQAHPTPAPNAPVPAGTTYSVAVPGGDLRCSTGFAGQLGGKDVVVSAAHCASHEGDRAALDDGTQFGTVTSLQRDNLDSAIITVDGPQAPRFATNRVASGPDQTIAVTGTVAPVVGMKACKSGARTGYSCGTITQVGQTIDVAGERTVTDSFLVDLCALPGDSGGVIVAGDKALGISSASNVADAVDCAHATAAAQAAGVTPSLAGVPIDDVLKARPGLTLRTS